MRAKTAYDELIRRVREQSVLGTCSALLGWDEQTYMPRGGAENRGEQLALLAGIHHARATDPRVGELLGELEGSDLVGRSDGPEAVNVREVRRQYGRLTRLPRSLVEEIARTTSVAQGEWTEARREGDFGRLRPRLESVFTLKRREAECLAHPGGLYDALLDEYEPGATTRRLGPVFDALRDGLAPLLDAILGSGRGPGPAQVGREFPVDRQRIFVEAVAAEVGFDFDRGRIDPTAHPFCTHIGPGDCRVATRFDARDLGDGFFSTLHEVGHALYDQGLDPAHHGTPMGEPASLGVHESQSRLWENVVGRGLPAWRHWFPLARRLFPSALRDVEVEAFHSSANRVEPSPIRVDADEVTYNLHIFVRYELERALLAGDLPVADLPGAWDESYRRHLGIVPADAAEGCLQDIHWSAGLIGYFPTYSLGNVFAAQLFEAARADLGDLDAAFATGDFAGLLGWLRDHVHRQGRRHHSPGLIEAATGSPPGPSAFVAALRRKFRPLYRL